MRACVLFAMTALLVGFFFQCGPAPTPEATPLATSTEEAPPEEPTEAPSPTPSRKPSATPFPTPTATPAIPIELLADYEFVQCIQNKALPVGEQVTDGISSFSDPLAEDDWDTACSVIPAWVLAVEQAIAVAERCPEPSDSALIGAAYYYINGLEEYKEAGDCLLEGCTSSSSSERSLYSLQALEHMNTANESMAAAATALGQYTAE